PALPSAVTHSLPGGHLGRGKIGEPRRASLNFIAAVKTRRRRPVVANADIHARVAILQLRNCELRPISVVRTIQRHLDLDPSCATIGRPPDTTTTWRGSGERGCVECLVRPSVKPGVELHVVDPPNGCSRS